MYAPWPASQDPNGIIAFFYQPSDDGKLAVVEFVARQRAAFQAILSDKTIKVFDKGGAAKGDIEAALKQFRKERSAPKTRYRPSGDEPPPWVITPKWRVFRRNWPESPIV